MTHRARGPRRRSSTIPVNISLQADIVRRPSRQTSKLKPSASTIGAEPIARRPSLERSRPPGSRARDTRRHRSTSLSRTRLHARAAPPSDEQALHVSLAEVVQERRPDRRHPRDRRAEHGDLGPGRLPLRDPRHRASARVVATSVGAASSNSGPLAGIRPRSVHDHAHGGPGRGVPRVANASVVGLVGQRGSGSHEHGVCPRPKTLHVIAGRRSSDPLRRPVDRRRLAVEAGCHLQGHEGRPVRT